MTISERADNHANRWNQDVLELIPEDVSESVSEVNREQAVNGQGEISYCFEYEGPDSRLTFRCRICTSEAIITPVSFEVYYTNTTSNKSDGPNTTEVEIQENTMSDLTRQLLKETV